MPASLRLSITYYLLLITYYLPLRDSAGLVKMTSPGFPHCAPRFRATGAPSLQLFSYAGEYNKLKLTPQISFWR